MPCEAGAVVIRNVSDIALLGSEDTVIKRVPVPGGQDLNIIEPSTVIDCLDCSTGFSFISVSKLSVRRIVFTRCGVESTVGYGDWSTQVLTSTIALSIVGGHNITLDTVLFQDTIGSYSLVLLNVNGRSVIVNTTVVQDINPKPAGTIALLFRDFKSRLPINQECEKSELLIESLNLIYKIVTTAAAVYDFLMYLEISILSCYLDIDIYLRNVTMHTTFNNSLIPRASKNIVIELHQELQRYRIMLDKVKISGFGVSGSIDFYALRIFFSDTTFSFPCPPSETIEPKRIIIVSGLIIGAFNGVHVSLNAANKGCENILFSECQIPSIYVSDWYTNTGLCPVIFNASTIGERNSSTKFPGLVIAKETHYLEFNSCSIAHNWMGSGMYIESGSVYFRGMCTFYNNTAKYGGGILMDGSHSLLHMLANTTLNFTSNAALITGGALHINSDNYDSDDINDCFIQLPNACSRNVRYRYSARMQGIQLIFTNNTAGVAGMAIWGGAFYQRCKQLNCSNSIPFDIANAELFNDRNSPSNPSIIASSPRDICYCNNSNIINKYCTASDERIFKKYGPSLSPYPGQELKVSIALLGQLRGLVTGLVQADLKQTPENVAHFGALQRTQRISQAKCTAVVYTIYSSVPDPVLELHMSLARKTEHESESLTYHFFLSISAPLELISSVVLQRCPVGFTHDTALGLCACFRPLLQYVDNSCDIDTQTIQRKPALWLYAFFTDNYTQTLAAHEHCPFDYCNQGMLRVNLRHPDSQCAHNRSGILCGECQDGLSLTLGSPKCQQCSNRFLSLFSVFLVAGILLVVFLTCLNLTVSVGAINGLLLYANIIWVNRTLFFPSTSFLSVFLAWINLDLGLNVCLYDGLNLYSFTWLQFLFPVYIWALVIFMVITGHYNSLAAKVFGRDTVKVLATLFLLSFAKLLRAIITVISFTYVTYEESSGNVYKRAVWLHDGNVDYLKGKHIPLFLVALVFGICYIAPFSILLLFAPCLQAQSHHYRVLRWVNRIMPFLDCYQGPYNSSWRCWSGILLLARTVLFVGFALNTSGDPLINLKLILTFFIGLISLQGLLGIVLRYDSL